MKTLIGYIAVGLIKVMGLLSLSGAQKLGRFIGWTLWIRKTRSREVARVNAALCFPEKTKEEQDEFVRAALIEGAMTTTEVAAAWGWEPEKGRALIKGVEGEDALNEALAENRGTLFMPLHHGNWEFLNHVMQGRGKLVGMYRPAKMPPFDKFMHDSRARLDLGLVPTTREGVQAMFDTLERGDIAVVLPDQEPRRPYGEFVKFFGVDALTPKLPYELIQKTGCNVVFGFCERLPNAEGFRAHFVKADDAIYSPDMAVQMQSMNDTIEKCVRMFPLQFEWSYKRFKKQLDGKPNPYKQCP